MPEEFDRTSGIGGSDVAAILGLSPWRSAWDVWLEKTHDPSWVPQPETPQMRWGKLMEPLLAAEYERESGNRVRLPEPDAPPLWERPVGRAPVVYAHLDGVVYGKEEGVWEGKTASSDRDWSAGVPLYYETQVRSYLAITGESFADLSVLFPRGDFRTYRTWADGPLQDALMERLHEWWDDYVVTGRPPDVDGSAGAARFIAGRYPAPTTTEKMPYDATFAAMVRALLSIRHSMAEHEANEARMVNVIKSQMGEYPAADGEGWTLTWKRSAGYAKTDWKEVAKSYRAVIEWMTSGKQSEPVDLDAIESLFTRMTEGSRPFVLREED